MHILGKEVNPTESDGILKIADIIDSCERNQQHRNLSLIAYALLSEIQVMHRKAK